MSVRAWTRNRRNFASAGGLPFVAFSLRFQPGIPDFSPMFRLRLLRGGILSAALSLFVSGLVAGEPAKRPLTPQDFDGWRSLDTPVLSRDGRWLAYADMPQVDDGHLVVRELGSGRELREPAGARPPAPFPPPRAANPEDPPPARDLQIRLTSDSRFAVASTFPLAGRPRRRAETEEEA
jgi:hypothetical protein